jgi:hypothetical protein
LQRQARRVVENVDLAVERLRAGVANSRGRGIVVLEAIEAITEGVVVRWST